MYVYGAVGDGLCFRGLFVCFFFFQAEDGIRDWSVTGVQTCALPILKSGALPQRGMGSIKSRGAAATKTGQYKKRGAAAARIGKYKKRRPCSNEK